MKLYEYLLAILWLIFLAAGPEVLRFPPLWQYAAYTYIGIGTMIGIIRIHINYSQDRAIWFIGITLLWLPLEIVNLFRRRNVKRRFKNRG